MVNFHHISIHIWRWYNSVTHYIAWYNFFELKAIALNYGSIEVKMFRFSLCLSLGVFWGPCQVFQTAEHIGIVFQCFLPRPDSNDRCLSCWYCVHFFVFKRNVPYDRLKEMVLELAFLFFFVAQDRSNRWRIITRVSVQHELIDDSTNKQSRNR